MKVEVEVLGSPSLIVCTVSADLNQHCTLSLSLCLCLSLSLSVFRAQELCESRGGRPGLPVPNSLYGLCGRKATLNSLCLCLSVCLSVCLSLSACLCLSTELRSCVKVEVTVLGSRPQ